jgi:hypothetical protein
MPSSLCQRAEERAEALALEQAIHGKQAEHCIGQSYRETIAGTAAA